MAIYLKITSKNMDNMQGKDLRYLEEKIKKNPELTVANPGTIRATEIIVALGTAGAFTALYKVIRAYIEKDFHKEFIIERTVKGKKTIFVLNGYNTKDLTKLLQLLPPELKGE